MNNEEIFLNVPVQIDIYNGLTIDFFILLNENKQSPTVESFRVSLKDALEQWVKIGRKCIWFRIPDSLSNLIPALIENSFKFHHAKDNYVMLMKWLDVNQLVRAPKYAHTTFGVGGLVYSPETQKVLLIQEKTSRVRIWKFPGGYSEPKEDICTTATREVFEETGIECEFKSLISFRQRPNGIFGCSDFYFVCMLVPKKNESEINSCQYEIDACKWFDLESARKLLCGFNIYVFEKFLEQYSLLEYSNVAIEDRQTIKTEIIDSQYGHIKLKELVYSVKKSEL